MKRFAISLTVLLAIAPAAHADSLWTDKSADQTGALYTRHAPEHGLGDIVTIKLIENVSATNKVELDTNKESQKELRLQGVSTAGLLQDILNSNGATNVNFKEDATSEFQGDGENKRSQRLLGTVSGQIVEVLDNGTLRVEATQAVHVNEETNTIVLTGIVRPLDIDQRNTIESTRIANAEIYYTGRGPISNTNRRGLFTEILEYLWPF